MASRTRGSQPDAPHSIDPESLPPPMRRAYERCREPDGPRHLPSGKGAHIYARVSSEEQAGAGKTSLDEQIRLCEKLLASTSIPIIGIWRDEGFTGVSRLSERPIGRELVDAIKPGEIVVAYRLDRFSRNALLGLADINELRQHGVGLFIAGDHRWIPPAGSGELDPISEFNLQQGIITAQLERGLVVDRTQAGKRALIQRGYWPYATSPYGWRREHDGVGFKLVPDDDEQKVLGLMRRCHRRNASVPQITAALNDAGFRNRRGQKFEYSGVYQIMRNQGIIQPWTRSESRAKPTREKPSGNPTIAAASSAGVSAAVERKLHDAERVGPIITHLYLRRGCRTYRRLADGLNFLQVETPRDGCWYASSVKNAMVAAGLSLADLSRAAATLDQKAAGEPLPQRPNRSERQVVRLRYGLHGTPRGRVKKAAPDILFMRDAGWGIDDIARVLRLGRAGVKAIIQQHPRWAIDDPAVVEQILARHAAGESSRKIARDLGLDLKQVRRLTLIEQCRVKPARKRVPPLSEDRKAAIIGLRRQGMGGLEIFTELGVETEPERVQIRRFLQRQARCDPELALRNPPTLTDEIAAAKNGAKPSAYYVRHDYNLGRYWDDKWKSPLPPEIVQAVELLKQGQSIAEVVDRTGLARGRVKYIRAALQAGRCGLEVVGRSEA
jgi:DNA invertase Pin-like site-specific DNA recombinase